MYQSLDENGGNFTESKNPDSGCQLLTFKDYTGMMWTTLAEIPGTVLTFVLSSCARQVKNAIYDKRKDRATDCILGRSTVRAQIYCVCMGI